MCNNFHRRQELEVNVSNASCQTDLDGESNTHKLCCIPLSQLSQHITRCGRLLKPGKYVATHKLLLWPRILSFVLYWLILLCCICICVGHQILNCLILILMKYHQWLIVLLKTTASLNSYSQSIGFKHVVDGGVAILYTTHSFSRHSFALTLEDDDQDIITLSDGPNEIVTCIKCWFFCCTCPLL